MRSARAIAALVAVALLPGIGRGEETTASAIQAVLATTRGEIRAARPFEDDRDLVDRLYRPGADAPLWSTRGRPNARARDAIAALRTAPARGLEPDSYDGGRHTAEATRLDAGRAPSARDLARFDVDLSAALVRFVVDLHAGRVDPRALGFDYDPTPKRAELAALVDDLARGAPIGTVVDAAAPPYLQTLLLERALARYRALAADPTVASVAIGATVRPGEPLAAAEALAHWLVALGDLPADASVGDRYQGALVAGVQRFQRRHGLAPDGVIGSATARALAAPASARARQIALALERLRWLPALGHERVVIVNVPAFEALAFDDLAAGQPAVLRMSVVVGQALRTETPFFTGAMTSVVFAPYWNVPSKILRTELLPRIRARPGWLADQQMEIVSAGHVLAPTADAVARLARGTAELRQRPGVKNALGRVKFLFHNAYDVYMHDTPARELFARARRDFSHGCIRLSDAPALAGWVLGAEGIDAGRVDELLASERQTIVQLSRPITVVIAYATAVAHRDGTISFYDDVYGHDAALADALLGSPTSP